MKCANEFSNSPTLANLGQSKIFALLDIPIEEREEFISSSHEVSGKTKTIEEMTARELQQAIKEKKIDFSKTTAYKFIKVATEYNNESVQSLGQTKTVEEMTARELQQAIKEKNLILVKLLLIDL